MRYELFIAAVSICKINKKSLAKVLHIVYISIMKIVKAFRLDLKLIEELQLLADEDSRKLNNYVEKALKDHVANKKKTYFK